MGGYMAGCFPGARPCDGPKQMLPFRERSETRQRAGARRRIGSGLNRPFYGERAEHTLGASIRRGAACFCAERRARRTAVRSSFCAARGGAAAGPQ